MPRLKIEPITIGELTLIDPQDATADQAGRAGLRFRLGLERWFKETDHPDFGYETFCVAGNENPDLPGGLDPELPVLTATVLKDGLGHGFLSISNIRFEFDNPRRIEASAFGLYASHPGSATAMLEESATVCTYLMDNDITLKDGRTLDIVEWELLFNSRLRTREIIDLGPWFTKASEVGLGHPAMGPGESIPARMRRGDAPRQRPGDVQTPRTLPPRGVRPDEPGGRP
jgi:hypothetical protein